VHADGVGQSVPPAAIRMRIVAACRIDRIRTHARGVTVDTTTQSWVIDGHAIPE